MKSIFPFTTQTSQALCSRLVTLVHLQYQITRHKAITSKKGSKPGLIIVCFIVHKTTLELEHWILTTLYLADVKNTDSWCTRNGDSQHAFPLNVLMVHSSALAISVDGEHLMCGGLSIDETVHLGSFEFIANYFSGLSLSPRRNDSGTAIMSSTHSRPLFPRQTMIEDSTKEFHTASSGEGGSDLPSSRRHDTGALPNPITTPPWLEQLLWL
jgi:hypothetical protein